RLRARRSQGGARSHEADHRAQPGRTASGLFHVRDRRPDGAARARQAPRDPHLRLRSAPVPGRGRRRAGELRGRGHAGRAPRRGGRGRGAPRAAGRNPADDVPGGAGGPHRADDRAVPGRGDAPSAGGGPVTVTVVMHGTLRRFLPEGAARATLELRDGATVGEVLAELGAETTEHETWLVARNEGIAERDHVLEPGDVLDCFEPLAGGAGRATREAGPCRYAM